MSIDIPADIEPAIERYARSARITTDEAVVRLITEGLNATAPVELDRETDPRMDVPLGEPPTDEEAAIMDDVVAEAMQARSERWEHLRHG